MSASAHHPPWGRASDTDPGGTGTRQLQGAWARKRVFNTLTPGLYRHDVESGTTWAGVAAEKAKERYFVDGKKTNTIVVGLFIYHNKVSTNTKIKASV